MRMMKLPLLTNTSSYIYVYFLVYQALTTTSGFSEGNQNSWDR
jgi:hypothetical protein